MQEENGFLTDEQAEHLTRHAVARNEDGSYSWKFDQYTRPFAPVQLAREQQQELWKCIRGPVLHIRGTESWAGDPEQDGRLALFQDARRSMSRAPSTGSTTTGWTSSCAS